MLTPKLIENDDCETKIDVLKHLHSNVFSEMQEFRATLLKLVIAIGGMILAIVGWGATKSHELGTDGLIIFALGIVALVVLMWGITTRLEGYFKETAEVINKIEHLFRCYEDNAYLTQGEFHSDCSNKKLFPANWEHFGNPTWSEPIFHFSKRFILVLGIFGVLSMVWLSIKSAPPHPHHDDPAFDAGAAQTTPTGPDRLSSGS